MLVELQTQLAVELHRRGEMVPRELKELTDMTEANAEGMGIHRSQVRAIKKLLEGLLQKQQNLLSAFADAPKAGELSREEFTLKRERLQDVLTGTHSVIAVFNHVFEQRKNQDYRGILDAADLLATYCYQPCIDLANKWRKEPEGTFREPPLTYLNAARSAAAIARHETLGEIGLALFSGMELLLPIPVISLTFHDTAVFWSLCSLYHESGHLLSLELGISEALKEFMQASLKASDNKQLWGDLWMEEMVADTFGVLLGGAGYAYSLMNLLFNTSSEVITDSGLGAHPNSYVRVFLLGALLRGTGVAELGEVAKRIEDEWREFYGDPPNFLRPFVSECDAVAEVLLHQPLAPLSARCMHDFARNNHGFPNLPDCARDHERVVLLSDHLRNLGTRPVDADNSSWIRLVPAAAQMAVRATKKDVPNKLLEINTRAASFLNSLPRPAFLAGVAPAVHNAYIDGLVESLDFSTLRRKAQASPKGENNVE
jgi:hypothetical protein